MDERVCKHPGCDRPQRANGWCAMHYMRARRAATSSATTRRYGWHPFDRVMLRVEWVGDCLEYTGCRTWHGYGDTSAGRAHVIVWEYHNGPVPEGQEVRHFVCDNPPCVNIDHLRIGTRQDNVNDAVAKDRHAHGERSGNAKLTGDQVRYIRASSERGVDLALMFGVSKQTVCDIRAGRSWKRLSEGEDLP